MLVKSHCFGPCHDSLNASCPIILLGRNYLMLNIVWSSAVCPVMGGGVVSSNNRFSFPLFSVLVCRQPSSACELYVGSECKTASPWWGGGRKLVGVWYAGSRLRGCAVFDQLGWYTVLVSLGMYCISLSCWVVLCIIFHCSFSHNVMYCTCDWKSWDFNM